MKRGEKRTYAERRTYLIAAVKKRRRMVRQRAIDHKGGKCQLCGYARCKEALEFHHREGELKNFGVSS